MSVDHTPAWALISWYGDDGMGGPTLDDWQVWADWLRAHDPDDERDADIAEALNTWNPLRAFPVERLIAWAYSAHQDSAGFSVGRGVVRMRFGGDWLKSRLLGFEVQPTQREMRRPRNYSALAQAARSGRVAFPPLEGVDINGCIIIDEPESGWAPEVRQAFRRALGFGDPTAATALHDGRRIGDESNPPRNPRRRGDTGAHGRARR